MFTSFYVYRNLSFVCCAGISQADETFEFTVQVSYVEIYLEKVRDLLNPIQDNLRIRENAQKGIYIDGITDIYVGSFMDVLAIMKKGEMNRSIASTRMNAKSSRRYPGFRVVNGFRHSVAFHHWQPMNICWCVSYGIAAAIPCSS